MTEVEGLRILAFCDYFSLRPSGGAERVAHEVYRRLVRSGAHVVLLTTGSSNAARSLQADGIEVRVVPALDLRRVTRAQVSVAPGVVREANTLAERFRPDVLHANGLHFQTSVAAAILQRRERYPMATTVHVAGPSQLPTFLRGMTSLYERSVGRFILRSSTRIIAVSAAAGEHARRLGASGKQTSVIPNGVDHEQFFPSEAGDARRERPLVLCVGRLIANKGPQLLIEALAMEGSRLEADVVFLGDGPLRAQLEREAVKRGLQRKVRFEGQSSDIASWLRRADVLVRPSFTEGLPLTLLEAMASSVCVVASDIPGNSDLVRHGETGLLFQPGQARSLLGALERVLENPAARRRMAANGWQTSLGYSWDACAEALGLVLTSAARSGRGA